MSDVALVLFGEYGMDRAAQGVAGAAQSLKAAAGGSLTAVVVGPPTAGMTEALSRLVDRVVVAAPAELSLYQPEAALAALEQILRPLQPRVVVLGNDTYSQEVTPRLAHRLGGSSLADAIAVGLEGGELRATRSAYGGKALAVYSLKRSPAVVSVRARALAPAEPSGAQGVVEQATVTVPAPALRIVERGREAQAGVRLEDARVIVSGGRGLGGPEPFEGLKTLAATIGAQTGASRAACDAGWVPPSWQVGQTGKKVAPELYIAIAISGASQHLLGMGDSKVIAAINTDPDAPIFKHCSFGIVEDYRKVVPLLTAKLAELREMNPAGATREVFWNITQIWVMYALLVPTTLIAGFGLYRRFRLWRTGKPAARFDRPGERVRLVLKHAVAQRRVTRQSYAGAFHLMLYSGFVILTIATTVVAVHEDLKLRIMQGRFYLYFQSFTVDVFGALVLVGVGLAAYRRWLKRPRPLVYTEEASLILVAIFVMCVNGFLLEGWRIAVTDDPWGHWSPIGFLLARASKELLSVEAMQTAHLGFWWFHLVSVYAFLAWAPYTKMAHVLTAPLNIYTANLDGYGASLKRIDFDTAQSFGVNALSDLTWKDLLDLDACTECGRCTAVCPAATVGKELSPRDLILDLRNLMHRSEQAMLAAAAAATAAKAAGGNGQGGAAAAAGGGAPGQPAPDVPKVSIIDEGSAMSPTALWQCTTCAACMEACPVYIEQMPKIVDARRWLVMEQAEFPESLQAVVTSLEQRSHPFPGTSYSRVSWAEGLDVKVMGELADPAEAEVLLWVGCGGALVERNQKSTRALAQLLTEGGVKFAILGREEGCTGDPARRIGNEFLFEMLAKGNVETLDGYGVKKIVTSCPHCFNTFANEYPHLGGHYEVMHHTQMLAALVEQGKLRPEANGHSVTFHDPCYLGRHNGVFDQPRELVRLTSRSKPIEMKRSREQSFCCGGGGGMCYVDEKPDQRVNQNRADEAIATGADVVAVGCPFCTTMLEDGIAARKGDRNVVVRDVSELLWESVSAGKAGPAAKAVQS